MLLGWSRLVYQCVNVLSTQQAGHQLRGCHLQVKHKLLGMTLWKSPCADTLMFWLQCSLGWGRQWCCGCADGHDWHGVCPLSLWHARAAGVLFTTFFSLSKTKDYTLCRACSLHSSACQRLRIICCAEFVFRHNTTELSFARAARTVVSDQPDRVFMVWRCYMAQHFWEKSGGHP